MQHLVHIIQLLSDFVRVHFTDTPACLSYLCFQKNSECPDTSDIITISDLWWLLWCLIKDTEAVCLCKCVRLWNCGLCGSAWVPQ